MSWAFPEDNELFIRSPQYFPEIWDFIFLRLSIGERMSARKALPEWRCYIDQDRFSGKIYQFQYEKCVRENDSVNTKSSTDPVKPPIQKVHRLETKKQ